MALAKIQPEPDIDLISKNSRSRTLEQP